MARSQYWTTVSKRTGSLSVPDVTIGISYTSNLKMKLDKKQYKVPGLSHMQEHMLNKQSNDNNIKLWCVCVCVFVCGVCVFVCGVCVRLAHHHDAAAYYASITKLCHRSKTPYKQLLVTGCQNRWVLT